MPIRKKSVKAAKNTAPPLYSLSNEELKALNKNPADAGIGYETHDILTLRRNIDLLSQSTPFDENVHSTIADETSSILCCFSSLYLYPCPDLLFLSRSGDTGENEVATYPLSLYLRIDDGTTIQKIKKHWAQIRYWRDYVKRAQGPDKGEDFLLNLHTKNMAGTGYGALAKEVSRDLEAVLRSAVSNNKWVKRFEKELRSYLSKKEATGNPKTGRSSGTKKKERAWVSAFAPLTEDFSQISRYVRYAYFSTEPKKRRLAEVYKIAPIKALDSIPEKNPFANLESEALAVLTKLRYTEKKANESIKTAMQDITERQKMTPMVTANHVRETLRWWRNKYDYPSPGKTGLG